jgi:hypothetical protein|tara:strand:+ start:287 stop:514 length:228 start_codon:yes stop_codon:yes gene_type:complete
MRKTINWLGMLWSAELRNGVGFDVEFVDSRPVWVMKIDTRTGVGSWESMPFEGVVILLPFININIGRCYVEVDDE